MRRPRVNPLQPSWMRAAGLRKRLSWLALRGLVLVALLGLVGAALAADSITIDWQVIAGGGGRLQGAGISINDTIGQPVVGLFSGPNISLSAGYWAGIPARFNVYLPLVTR